MSNGDHWRNKVGIGKEKNNQKKIITEKCYSLVKFTRRIPGAIREWEGHYSCLLELFV